MTKFHSLNNFSTRYSPFLYALLSYYSHTYFLFKGFFDDDNDP
jgi:hypothetical protein